MLTLLLGVDWVANRDAVLDLVAEDVKNKKSGRILMVPELISHDMERRLCQAAGDAASRYAEVLSFTRLGRRVSDNVGHAARQCLDNGGRVVAMASAVYQVRSKLKAYASVGTRPEFLIGLVEAVDEFKRCCIRADALMWAAKQAEGSFAQKLEELALIFESYDSVCAHGKRDPGDQMTWLLEELELGGYSENRVFYIDGFPDFTRQHMAILEHLICNAENVTVSLNCDTVDTHLQAFEKAGQTAGELVRAAQKAGIPVQILHIAPRKTKVSDICTNLFQGQPASVQENVSVFRARSVHQESMEAAQRVLELIQNGARYRDIGIVCADMSLYKNVLSTVFDRCRIPLYIAGTEDILEKTVIATVLAAVDTAMGAFDQSDVLRYIKSALSPIDLEICDELENYAVQWGIYGNRWLQEWKFHPDGLGKEWSSSALDRLAVLNMAREKIVTPLEALRRQMLAAVNVGQQVRALYDFFQVIELPEHLDAMASGLDRQGDNRGAQILSQLWEILIGALEQLNDILGNNGWDSENFTRLLRILLGQYDVGTIPPVLDAVTAGSISAMRCQEVKHLFVLGAQEGLLPKYATASGVLTDHERSALRALGVPLSGGSMDGLKIEFFEIYNVFCGASDSITVSCPAGEPSYIYQRVQLMGNAEEQAEPLGSVLADVDDAAAYFARNESEGPAQTAGLDEAYDKIIRKRDHQLGVVTGENVKRLYGTKLYLSASQVDSQAGCRFSYFLRYGLKAKERKPITIDPAEFGTYVHAVLENTVSEVMEKGGFRVVTMDDTLEIARRYSDAYAKERFSDLDSERLTYLFNRNTQELALIVQDLWEELNQSQFLPRYFELHFADGEPMPAIPIDGHTMDAVLTGYVDRVDIWEHGDNSFFRVVDYKTGSKDIDFCDIFNGLGLQMLLYLYALEQGGQALIGSSPVPAGVQYFTAKVPMMDIGSMLPDEKLSKKLTGRLKRPGILLKNDDVLYAMEPASKPIRMCYSRTKDGKTSGNLVSLDDLALLKAYLFRILGELVDDIASGSVIPNPYTRGSDQGACKSCSYRTVCHATSVAGRRNYRDMNAERFWDEVRREMAKLG